MSVVTAYKCDATGKLFEDKTKYIKHIRKVAAERRAQRKLDAALKTEQQWWHDNFWNRVKSLDQLKAAILQHCDVFAARGVKEYFCGGRRKLKPTPLVEFNEFSLKFNDLVSNSHSCPVDGVTNWAGKTLLKDGSPAPRGYSGWQGRIDYIVQSHKGQTSDYPGGSDMWVGSRIHTGSGGGGGHRDRDTKFLQSFGYDTKLFASDWPAMANEYEKARLWKQLNNDSRPLDMMVNAWNPAEDY